MITYSDSTVFNADTHTIVNTINCQGVMGAGIALEFRLRFSEMFEDYQARCERHEVKVGKPYLYRNYHSFWILNFPTKNHWKFPSRIEWIEQGLDYFVLNYQKAKIRSIAFPKLGTSKGGLDWGEVKQVMEDYLTRVSIPVVICLDIDETAYGEEGRMVDLLNNLPHDEWVTNLRLNKRIIESLNQAIPIKRFSRIMELPGVGEKTYEKLFRYFYSKSLDQYQIDPDQQLTMF